MRLDLSLSHLRVVYSVSYLQQFLDFMAMSFAGGNQTQGNLEAVGAQVKCHWRQNGISSRNPNARDDLSDIFTGHEVALQPLNMACIRLSGQQVRSRSDDCRNMRKLHTIIQFVMFNLSEVGGGKLGKEEYTSKMADEDDEDDEDYEDDEDEEDQDDADDVDEDDEDEDEEDKDDRNDDRDFPDFPAPRPHPDRGNRYPK